MSLYDGLDIESKSNANSSGPDVAGWSAGYKMLQSSLQAKKASSTKKNKSISRVAPVVDLKKTIETDFGLTFDHLTGKLQRATKVQEEVIVPLQPQTLPFISPSGPSITGAIDEYDPLHPNEYEVIVKLRKEEKDRLIEEDRRRQQEEDRKKRYERDDPKVREEDNDRDRRSRDRHDDRELDRPRRRRDEDEDDYDRPKRSGGSSGAAVAPPQALIEDDIAAANKNRPEPPTPASGASVASKIMAKYGYKQGQGLGKSEQGMSIALQVEKTSKRGGKIIHERDLLKANAEAQAHSNTNLMRNPSKVILLLNMVGPGEVDEELEPETAEECGKYGKVMRCVVYEIPDAPDDQAVRLFIEFERMESAIKALVDLNGRFFGGRAVRACFYNLDKFRRLDYLDNVD